MTPIIKTSSDKEKAKSILKMANTTLEMIESIDTTRFSTNIIKEKYEIIRELITIILLLDGYKTYGEGSHKDLIIYLNGNYNEFTEQEIRFIEELRTLRNKIAYNGFFIKEEFLKRKKEIINVVITKLKIIIKDKLSSDNI